MGAGVAGWVDCGAESLAAAVGFLPDEFTLGVRHRRKDFDERMTQVFMNLLYGYGDGHEKGNKLAQESKIGSFECVQID